MADDEPVILAPAEARRRYLWYVAMKLAGLAALILGVFMARDGVTGPAIAVMGVGLATVFVRPRMMGLTPPKRKQP